MTDAEKEIELKKEEEKTQKETTETTKKVLKEVASNLPEKKKDDEENHEVNKSIDKKIKETQEKLRDLKDSVNHMRNDGEMATAFFIIFSNFTNIFHKEVDKLKKNLLIHKIKIYEDIRDEFDKNGKLTKEMLEKAELSDKQKETLIKFSEDTELEKPTVFEEVLNKAKENLDATQNIKVPSVVSILADSEVVKSVVKEEIKDELPVLKDLDKNKNFDRQRNR